MAQQNFPSFSELQEIFIQKFETELSQTSPLNNKAFNRIVAFILAMIAMLMQREVGINTKNNFALTADREHLQDPFGKEYNTPIKEAQSTVLNITIPMTTGQTIDAGTNYTGPNGVLYFDATTRTAVAGVVTSQVTARDAGAIGNLIAGQDTLEISTNPPGLLSTTATIVSTENTGADAEETEIYRQRILDIERAPGGGGNSADYRNWAQQTTGITRAFPYAALPFDHVDFPGSPPQRTVYGQADESIDADGIAGASLLNDMKDTIMTSLITLQHQEPLGLTNYELYVQSIRRTAFYTQLTGAVFVSGTEAAVKTKIAEAVDIYYRSLFPWIDGLDATADKNDFITSVSVSDVVQPVLKANGASAESIDFSDIPLGTLPSYLLGQGEMAKSGGVNYV